jgi:hypothetical protein
VALAVVAALAVTTVASRSPARAEAIAGYTRLFGVEVRVTDSTGTRTVTVNTADSCAVVRYYDPYLREWYDDYIASHTFARRSYSVYSQAVVFPVTCGQNPAANLLPRYFIGALTQPNHWDV